jgi:hypothetical protein
MICESCGAVLLRRAWHRGRSLGVDIVDYGAEHVPTPACLTCHIVRR